MTLGFSKELATGRTEFLGKKVLPNVSRMTERQLIKRALRIPRDFDEVAAVEAVGRQEQPLKAKHSQFGQYVISSVTFGSKADEELRRFVVKTDLNTQTVTIAE